MIKRSSLVSGTTAGIVLGAALVGFSSPAFEFTIEDTAEQDDQHDYYYKKEQGTDFAQFSDGQHDHFRVCDREDDGHAVYVHFSGAAENGEYYYDRTGPGDGCTDYTTNSGEVGVDIGSMYVCEQRWGPDFCSNGQSLSAIED
ncbi:hypothetical protein INP57_19340 [Saccharopolyspora sp. HNM0986]|uniref:hypothetical protein n=1 Tax=Saccharopolyspora galaxeae TaxID=2781241 RepID=UPI00190D68C2|nr:hypothetical protein [Saccharopolyspora sp. HNM0986]MBK0868966.1 hypothetical protein [Saccharopolyspora sp. HNM0986]